MAAFGNDDRWMARGARQDSDDLAAHPLFGGGGNDVRIFADVTGSAQNAFNVTSDDLRSAGAMQQQGYGGGVRCPSPIGEQDEDDVHVLNAPSGGMVSTAAQPASQQYTEAASSEAFSQESLGSQSAAKLRTEEFLGFWAHQVPRNPADFRQHPPNTPQRPAGPPPDESPSALVDGIVRAGLETPSRRDQYARPSGGGAYEPSPAASAQTRGSSADNVSPMSSHIAPSSNASSVGGILNSDGRRFRTVQQHFGMQQGAAPGQSRSPPTGTSRPMAPSGAVPRVPNVGGDGAIVVLEFKMERRRRFRCPRELVAEVVPDTWVVVALDNGGVDMGTCVEVYRMPDRMSIPKHYGHGEGGTVLRLANDDDCRVINDEIPPKEEAALAKAHQLVHFLHMPFTCIDAEFQFDLKVVNLYYTLTPQASTSVIPNVSRLQRELGFFLKARVHLEQLVPIDD